MRTFAITSALIITLLFGGFAVLWYIDRNFGRHTREQSRMMSVEMTTAGALSTYYKEHGKYPRTLSELPLDALRWGDEGSSPRDLIGWKYASDGSSFSMTWTNKQGPELFLGGRNGQIYYSKNDMQ